MPGSDETPIALSGVLAEIAEVAGQTAALQIAHAQGGRECVYIPTPEHLDRDPAHWMIAAVGSDAARAIAAAMGGQSYAIPLGPFAGCLNHARRALATALQDGHSAAKAARLAGVTERTAWNVKARRRDLDKTNHDLFERKA